MAITLKDKKNIVNTIRSNIVNNSLSVIIADASGVTVNKMTELRQISRKLGIHIHVIRNTLIKRIINGTMYNCLEEVIVGPNLIAFSKEHPSIIARLFKEFAKQNPTFNIKAAAFEGKFISQNQINYLANLPTYKEAIIRLIITIKELSIGKLICCLNILCKKKTTL